jgi:hypothetical protein
MKMIETEKFFNAGYGWICKRCEKRKNNEKTQESTIAKSAQVKWLDPSRRNLYCPRCGVTEEIDKA